MVLIKYAARIRLYNISIENLDDISLNSADNILSLNTSSIYITLILFEVCFLSSQVADGGAEK